MLTGELLRFAGINLCLGPVLDLAVPGGPEGAWGMDPQRVIDHAGQWNRWLRKRGVAGCGGRFPIGLAPACADDADVLQRGALLPYTALMPELDAIRMAVGEATGVEAGLPATLASGVVRRLLRDRLGFDHHAVIGGEAEEVAELAGITPAQAARMAVEAGCDLVMVKNGASLARPVAMALEGVSGVVRRDAWMRVERLGDRLHWPAPWSDAKWRDWFARAVETAGGTG
jgi:beta-N-acetylhexosaminidase